MSAAIGVNPVPAANNTNRRTSARRDTQKLPSYDELTRMQSPELNNYNDS